MALSAPIPGPPSIPLLGIYGNALRFLRDPIGNMQRLYHTYGPVAALAQGQTKFVFGFGPEQNHEILSQPDLFHTLSNKEWPTRFPPDSAAWRMVEGGLLQMNGPRHKQQRRLIMPAFHKQRVEDYRDEMVALTAQRINTWQVGEQRDILSEMRALTLDIAIKALLGVTPDQEGQRVRLLFEGWINDSFSVSAMLLPVMMPGFPFYRSVQRAEVLEAEVLALITRRRASGQDGGDALSMLIQAHDEDGTRLTDTELIAQTSTLFAAGYITTASALTWALFLLAQHPQVYTDLLAELTTVLAGQPPTVAQLAALPLLDGVVRETLRLYPPLFWNARVVTAPTTLGSYHIPAGTQVFWSPAITHRIPSLYPAPLRFQPERWRGLSPSPYEYMPFGAGPRRCIGAEFAMLELRVVLPMILQRFRPVLAPQARVDLDRGGVGLVFLFPKGSLPMRLFPPGAAVPATRAQGTAAALVESPTL